MPRRSCRTGPTGPFVNDEFGDVTIVSTALTAKGFSLAEVYLKAKYIMDELYLVPGVGKVLLYDVQHERVWLDVSTAKLAQFGVSTGDIRAALEEENIILPGRTVDVGGRETTSIRRNLRSTSTGSSAFSSPSR